MNCAIDIAPIGELADPRVVMRLARAAEAGGWDGLSVWDNLGNSMGGVLGDPFVILSAVAAVTQRLRLIASVLILPRRRPQLVVQSVGTLDLLSSGRLVVGVGSGGDPPEFEAFGEDASIASRAARLDEALAIVDPLLRGETVEHEGPAYIVKGAIVGPQSVQRPRPPIWVGGMKPAARRRAARWEGWIAVGTAEDGSTRMVLTPGDFGDSVAEVQAERARLGRSGDPFDVAILGYSEPNDGVAAEYGRAGATWWLESLHLMRGSIDALMARIEAGPPSQA